MPATITRNVPTTFDATNISYIKGLMTAIGLPTSAIVYETTSEAIYKITRGTGTYADTYVRWYTLATTLLSAGNAGWGFQVGTGFASNAITGTNAIGVFPANNSGPSNVSYYTSIVSSDNTVRSLLTFNNAYSYTGSFALIQPTNTSLTASNAPLTYCYSAHMPGTTAGTNPPAASQVRSIDTAQYGANTGAIGLGTFQTLSFSNGLSLSTPKAGVYGVSPNVPICSGGWPIGYNTNLAFVSSTFLVGDRVIVTAGSEEYMVMDRFTGVAIREI